ncbi:MAG: hypothetical protein M3Q87_04060 [Actinomycetota bacterium]|nr:hypothetical protein [Actinomycetota bacterium]
MGEKVDQQDPRPAVPAHRVSARAECLARHLAAEQDPFTDLPTFELGRY